MRLSPWPAVAVLLLAAVPAEARTVLAGTAFGSGFAGPMLVLAHLLGFLGIGLWAGQNGGAAVWQVPAAALTGALAAGLAAHAGFRLPYAAEGLAGSLVVVGVLVAFAQRVPLAVAVLVAAAAAAFHGYVQDGPPLAWAGFAGAVLLLTAAGVALVALLWQAVSARAVQMCGVAVAVVGVLDLAGVL